MSQPIHVSTSYEEIPRETRSALLQYEDMHNQGFEAYEYHNLPSDRKRIRLLRLLPGVLLSPHVLCEMFEAEFPEEKTQSANTNHLPRIVRQDGRLTDRIQYEALSWRWGDEDNSQHTIMIREHGHMYQKRVSETLGLALKYLRQRKDRILWIDAICINQKNKKERSFQVSMMSLVYTRAEQVCVWLGEDDDDSRKAFRFIREDISHLKDFDRLCSDQKNAHKWRAFLGLMQRDWFSRRWVVQEIALAVKAQVYCGPDTLNWRELAIAVELFVEVETATHRLSELLRKDAKSDVVPNWFEHISELGASLLVNATARIFREYQRGDRSVKLPARRSLLSLEYLVTSLSIFDCGRPHDSVYALLAIARDARPNPPTTVKVRRDQALIEQVFGDQLEQKPYLLDYSSPYPDVCKEFVQFCIERSARMDPLQALDVLCRPWAKDWRPGEFRVDDDEGNKDKKESPKKNSPSEISHIRRVWEISWSEDAEKMFEDANANLEVLAESAAQVTRPVDSQQEFQPQTASQQSPNPIASPSSSDIVRPHWREDWDSYLNARRKHDQCSESLYTIHKRPKTHQDNRSMQDYWNYKVPERNDTLTDFIKLAFPGRKDSPADAVSQYTSSSGQVRQYSERQEKEWRRDEQRIVQDLGPDPRFYDLLRAKDGLAIIDQARFQAAKGKTPRNGKHSAIRDGTRVQELGLPSWVAKIEGAPFDIFPHPGMDMVKMGRKNADPLVGSPQEGHRNYSAGQSKEVCLETLQIKRRFHLGHYSLYVKGFCFDKVAKVAQVSQSGHIPASWLDLGGWPEARRPTRMNGELDDPPTAFWRTLVADRGKSNRNPPYYYARACKETILKGGIRSNAVDTTALIYNERNSIIAEFCRRVQSVIWNRALIKTRKGALGLVSQDVREGDLICVIYGCTVPVILRRNNARFKTKNEQDSEKLEDGIEAMKRLVVKMERYRDRADRFRKLPTDKQAEVKKFMDDYNTAHPPTKDTESLKQVYYGDRTLDFIRQELGGMHDSQSDIEGEDSHNEFDDDDAQSDGDAKEYACSDCAKNICSECARKSGQETPEQKAEKERAEAERERQQTEMTDRHKDWQYNAKLRDPLRHYTFLDQAYIHGMMDGEAVRQKFYNGKPDHMFEIR